MSSIHDVSETIKETTDKVKLIAGAGYTYPGRPLAWIKDTGNGFILKFPSHSCTIQDSYVCLDYAEAEYALKLLSYLKSKEPKYE